MSEVVTEGAPAPAANESAPNGAPAPDATAAPEVGGEVKPEPKPEEKLLSQSEVDKIVQREKGKEGRRAERIAYERARRELAEQELARLRGEQGGGTRNDAPKGKPKAGDYSDPEEYLDKLADWKLDQREAARKEKFEREHGSREAQERDARNARFVAEHIVKPGKAKHADFDEVVLSDDNPVTDAMIAAAAKMPPGIGPEVLYQICSNPEELQRIAALSEVEQAWEMKDWMAKVKAPPKTTDTPPPIVPNGANGSTEKDTSRMSDAEWAKWRDEDLRKKHAR